MIFYKSVTEITKEKYVYMLLHPVGKDKRLLLNGHKIIYILGIMFFFIFHCNIYSG